jgi:hypothetical protein
MKIQIQMRTKMTNKKHHDKIKAYKSDILLKTV